MPNKAPGLKKAKALHRGLRDLPEGHIAVRNPKGGGTYHARIGRGDEACKASSTNSAYWAAWAAAEKYYGRHLLDVKPLDGPEQSATRFEAVLFCGKCVRRTSKQAAPTAAPAR